MTMMKAIVTIALTLAFTIALTTHNTKPATDQIQQTHHENEKSPTVDPTASKKRVSRFLATNDKVRNPRAADHCHKDGDVCTATNTYCCNNKCVDLKYDNHNCGACKHKCKFTEVCCRGQCVNLSYDKRHCGSCNHKCFKGQYCIYGMCDYA